MWNPFSHLEDRVAEEAAQEEKYLKEEKERYENEEIEVTEAFLRGKFIRRKEYIDEKVKEMEKEHLPSEPKYFGKLFDDLHTPEKDRPEAESELRERSVGLEAMRVALDRPAAHLAGGEDLSAKIRVENTNEDGLEQGSRGARTPSRID